MANRKFKGIRHAIKHRLMKSPFAKNIKDIQAKILYAKIPPLKSGVGRKTVYCISPYKTGTTYLSSCFSPEISQHEPLHHVSLKYLEKNFDGFFGKRMQHLNLNLECSGFWSAYVKELAENDIAKELEYLCILRSPSSWVTSVINHWHKPNKFDFKFEYTLELFWKIKVGVNIHELQIGKDSEKNIEIIDKLIQFYFDFTRKTSLLKNLTYISLNEIDNNLPLVESLINETSVKKHRWKREGKYKPFVYENQSVDKEYEFLTAKLIKERSLLSSRKNVK